MTCPNCDEPMASPDDRRWETEGLGEQPFTIAGCTKCLSGKNVHAPVGVVNRAEDAYWERRLAESREGADAL